jgi:hypothetical protein
VRLLDDVAKRSGPKKTRRAEDRIELRALAHVLKQVREEAKLSQKRLSILLGKYSTFMWSIESGHILVDFITMVDIAAITGVSVNEIVTRTFAEIEAEKEQAALLSDGSKPKEPPHDPF